MSGERLDAARLAPLPGAGWLVRAPGLVALCADADAAAMAAAAGRSGGRALVSLPARLAASASAFCVLTADEAELVIVARGEVRAAADPAAGPLALHGGDDQRGLAPLLGARRVGAVLGAGPAPALDGPTWFDGPAALERGVIPAAGFVLELAAAAPQEHLRPADAPPAAPEPAPDRAPDPGPAAALVGGRPKVLVRGVRCLRGHLNDPRAPFCRIDGTAMVQASLGFVDGPRPPLGVVVFDTGDSWALDRDTIIGRRPASHPRVVAGHAAALTAPGDAASLSRHHAELRLVGWDVQVVDLRSTNGTFLWHDGDAAWRRLPPGEPVRIEPGARLGFGQRAALFESSLHP
ncbi:MAG: FHA domain-containing protein [Acidimicrobiales bacterium]